MSNDFLSLMESIFADNLPIIVRCNGGSMRPTIPRNCMVRIEKILPDTVRLGDIVVYEQDDTHTIMHRVVRKTKSNGTCFIQTWGDNMYTPDNSVPLTAIKARVTGYQREEDGKWQALNFSFFTYIKFFFLRYYWYWSKRLLEKLFPMN